MRYLTMRTILILLLGFCLVPFTVHADSDEGLVDNGISQVSASTANEGVYERAIVEGVSSREERTSSTGMQVRAFQLRFLSGALTGQLVEMVSDVGTNPFQIQPSIGDKVVILIQSESDGQFRYFLEGFDRRAALFWLIVLFVVTLVLLSGFQGLKVAFSIAISIGLIGYVLIPLFLHGYNPVPIAIVLSGVFSLLSTGLATGWNKKSFITSVGTIGGALVAYAISWMFADWAHLSGLGTEEDRLFFEKNPLLQPRGLLFAGIIIAAAGVVEDVAVSIASGVAEVQRANHRLSFKALFQSGMTIGNDHMAALANTLVYAYVGGSLSTLLLYTQFGSSWLKFTNFDSVADEVIRSLAGTIGLIFTVPITALLAAWVMKRGGKTQKENVGS